MEAATLLNDRDDDAAANAAPSVSETDAAPSEHGECFQMQIPIEIRSPAREPVPALPQVGQALPRSLSTREDSQPAQEDDENVLLKRALRTLQDGTGFIPAEAIFQILNTFNPDVNRWFVVDPSTASSRFQNLPTSPRGLARTHRHMVFPVIINDNHFTIGIVNRQTQKIEVYDPYGIDTYCTETFRVMKRLTSAWTRLAVPEGPGHNNWFAGIQLDVTVRQAASDNVNCGAYACVCGIFSMLGKPLPAQIDPVFWRHALRIALQADMPLELCHGLGIVESASESLTFEQIRKIVDEVGLQSLRVRQRKVEGGLLTDLAQTVCKSLEEQNSALNQHFRAYCQEYAIGGENAVLAQFRRHLPLPGRHSQLQSLHQQLSVLSGTPEPAKSGLLNQLKKQAAFTAKREHDSKIEKLAAIETWGRAF